MRDTSRRDSPLSPVVDLVGGGLGIGSQEKSALGEKMGSSPSLSGPRPILFGLLSMTLCATSRMASTSGAAAAGGVDGSRASSRDKAASASAGELHHSPLKARFFLIFHILEPTHFFDK